MVLSGKVHPMAAIDLYQLLGRDDWIGRGEKKKKAHNAKSKEEKGIMYLS